MSSSASSARTPWTPAHWVSIAIVSAFVLLAAVSGAIVASDNMMMQVVAGGALLGLLLLGAPSVAVWLVVFGVLLITGPLVFYVPQAGRVPWLFSMLGFFLLGASILYEGLGKSWQRGRIPGFAWLAVAFVLYASVSSAWSELPANDTAGGVKRYLQYWGLMTALVMIPFSEGFIRRLLWVVVAMSVLQFPLALYQRIWLVPALPFNTLDTVVGTLELSPSGRGSSGVLGMWQVAVMAALVALYRERLLSGFSTMMLLGATFIPILVGDVNVMFLWLPLALAAVYWDQVRERPVAFLSAGAALLAVLVAFGAFYLIFQQTTRGQTATIEERLRDLERYNLGDQGYASHSDLNRLNSLSYWAQHHGMHDPVGTVFGHGLGSSFTGGEQMSELMIRHGGRTLDLVATGGLLWDLGIVGFLLVAGIFLLATLTALRLCRIAAPGFDRALARSSLASMLLLSSMMIYNNGLLQTPSQQVLTSISLGALAWLARKYDRLERIASSPAPATGGRGAGRTGGSGHRRAAFGGTRPWGSDARRADHVDPA